MKRLLLTIVLGASVALVPTQATALIMVHEGNDPVQDHGWPEGTLEVANLKSRVGYWAGPPFGTGAMHSFAYRSESEADLNSALLKFAGIRAPELQLVVHDGPRYGLMASREKEEGQPQIDWSFVIWIPESWHRLYNNPKNTRPPRGGRGGPVPPPRIEVYAAEDGIQFEEVQVPPKVTVVDKRTSSVPFRPEVGGAIRGTVYDMTDGKPIRSATVSLTPRGKSSAPEESPDTAAGGDGIFEILEIPSGAYDVGVHAERYASRRYGIYNHRSDSHALEAYLLPKASLSGVVVDNDGTSIEGVRVQASAIGIDGKPYESPEDQIAITDEDGRFLLEALPLGYATLRCTKEGYYHLSSWRGDQITDRADRAKTPRRSDGPL